MILWIKKTLLFILENILLAVLLMFIGNILVTYALSMNPWGLSLLLTISAIAIVYLYAFLTRKLARTPIMALLGLVFDKKISDFGIVKFILIGRFFFVLSYLLMLSNMISYTNWEHKMALWVFTFSIGVMYNLYFFWWVYKRAFYNENIFALSIGANIIQNRIESDK